jgi:hypothetical protein
MKTVIDPHGFRSTLRDWTRLQTDYSEDVRDLVLHHSRGKVKRAYDRDLLVRKRLRLHEDWSAYCLSGLDLDAKQDDTVLPAAAE